MHAKSKKKPWSVFIAIVLAALLGTITTPTTEVFGMNIVTLYDVVGKLFINALTLVVVPLVSASIITGIARIGNEQDFGRLSAKTFLVFISTTMIAICIGLFFINLIGPGYTHSAISPEFVGDINIAELQKNLSSTGGANFIELLMKIVPPNIVAAFSSGNMLGLIFFSLLFGYALSKIDKRVSGPLQTCWEGVFQAMIQITQLVMKVLPIGVFCLVSKTLVQTGMESFGSLAKFFFTVMLGFATFSFVAMPILLKFVGKVSPIRTFQALGPALITAFSTSSSSATLPITIDCVEKRAGVSNRICSLVIPLGTSINMSGSALYECAAAMFVAQVYGIHIPIVTQFLLVFIALLTSMGVAGIPSGSLVALVVILKSMGLPLEGMGLFFAIDRLIDMSRTAVNVFSDSCCAILVAKSEGENEVLTVHPDELEELQQNT